MIKKLFTSESVTEGHPDKMCDIISDSILDELLRYDNSSRVACEVCTTTGVIFVMGEITTRAKIDIPELVRNVVKEIGYCDSISGFDYKTCSVICSIDKQSGDISAGVNLSYELRTGIEGGGIGAGDQGIMFGYATDETEVYMPSPILYAHRLSKQLSEVRKKNILPYLKPDGKSQVTMEYNAQGKPVRIDTVVLAAQHDEDISNERLIEELMKEVCVPVLPDKYIDNNTRFLINSSGRFVIGGPCGDSGLTGRKIIIDTYGGMAHHGGGAFSGKDYSKVDRTASYYARYIAKNIVASGIASKCEVQLAYAIGVAKPVSVAIDTFGTGLIEDIQLTDIVVQNFLLDPESMVKKLNLKRPIYKQTAAYGHFGRSDLNLPWEALDMVPVFRDAYPLLNYDD